MKKQIIAVAMSLISGCAVLYLFAEILLSLYTPMPIGLIVPRLIVLFIGSLTTPPPPPGGPTPTWPATVSKTGVGNGFESLDIRTNGTSIFIVSHENHEGMFEVLLKDEENNQILILASCIGKCKEEKRVFLLAGVYTLEVTATGKWFIVVGSP